MAAVSITNQFLERVKPAEKGTVWYSDKKMSGFQVAVGKKTVTYYAFCVVKGRGKRVRVGYWPAMNAAEARTKAQAAIASFKMGDDPRRPDDLPTLRDIFDRSTRERLKDGRISEETVTYYEYLFDKYLRRFENRPANEITADDGRNLKDKLTPYVWNLVKRLVDASFKTLDMESPFKGVRANREHKRESNIESNLGWFEFVRRIDNPHRRRALLICALTGIRSSNVTSLKWEYLDFQNRTITLPKTKTQKNVSLPMSRVVHDLLLEHKGMGVQSEWVFPSHRRKGGHIGALYCGQPGRVHDLRRMHTSACYKARLFDTAVKKLRGDVLSEVHAGYFTDDAPLEWADDVAGVLLKDWEATPDMIT